MDLSTEALETLEARCRERGLPVTLQRRTVLAALLQRDDHPTADELFEIIGEAGPALSRATVFRTLETLVDLEMATRVCHPGSATRYDPRVDRHHHLVCDTCGQITDLEDSRLDALPIKKALAGGFRVRDWSVHIRGTCATCR